MAKAFDSGAGTARGDETARACFDVADPYLGWGMAHAFLTRVFSLLPDYGFLVLQVLGCALYLLSLAVFFASLPKQTCVGNAGTLIFCDTTGLHRGGDPVEGGRLLFAALYTTNASVQLLTGQKLYSVSRCENETVSPAAEYAINHLSVRDPQGAPNR